MYCWCYIRANHIYWWHFNISKWHVYDKWCVSKENINSHIRCSWEYFILFTTVLNAQKLKGNQQELIFCLYIILIAIFEMYVKNDCTEVLSTLKLIVTRNILTTFDIDPDLRWPCPWWRLWSRRLLKCIWCWWNGPLCWHHS